MATLNFPASPTDGQTYVVNGVTYMYVSAKQRWVCQSVAQQVSTSITVGTVPPSSPSVGDLWVDTN